MRKQTITGWQTRLIDHIGHAAAAALFSFIDNDNNNCLLVQAALVGSSQQWTREVWSEEIRNYAMVSAHSLMNLFSRGHINPLPKEKYFKVLDYARKSFWSEAVGKFAKMKWFILLWICLYTLNVGCDPLNQIDEKGIFTLILHLMIINKFHVTKMIQWPLNISSCCNTGCNLNLPCRRYLFKKKSRPEKYVHKSFILVCVRDNVCWHIMPLLS